MRLIIGASLQARRKQILFGPAEQRIDVGAAREARLLGGLGACPPRKILGFRPSEIVSGAILGRNSKSRTTCCQT